MIQAAKRPPFWARPRYLGLMFTALAVSLAVAVVTLHSYSAQQYERAIEMREVNLNAYDLMAAGWRSVNDYAFPATPGFTPETWKQEQEASLVALDATIKDYHANFAGKGPVDVRTSLAEYAALHDQILALVSQQRPFEAVAVANQALAKFSILYAASTKHSREYSSQAQSVNRLATGGMGLATMLTMLAAVLVYRRFRNSQRLIEKAEAESEIAQRSEARFRPLIENSNDLISVIDAEGKIKFASPGVLHRMALTEDGVIGRSLADMLHGEDAGTLSSFVAEVQARPDYHATIEVQLIDGNQQNVYLEMTCTNLLNNPEVAGLVLNAHDITERRILEEQLRTQAFNDSLTGLANRLRFTDRLEHALQRGQRAGSKPVGVLYADLDYFKNVNDDLGHSAGDDLLSQVAARMLACIRSTDTAARLGGDEFAVLLEDVDGIDDCRVVAESLLAELNKPFNVTDHNLSITASIGIVLAQPYSMTAEEVMRDADVAMYDAKKNGRGRYQVYEPEMRSNLVERLHLISDLNRAIERDEFIVYYQPCLDIETETIRGFEALVRWNHPTRGLLFPDEFIPVAEETGAILPLGEIVLTRACLQAQEWAQRYPGQGLTMSVNASAKQVQRAGFAEVVERTLADTGFDPHLLVIEITETALVAFPERVIEALRAIKALGVQVALDDFGTGYSSLGHLKQFPIDILKIDKGFVEGLDSGEKENSLVRTVIDLGRTLSLQVVAEGIERPAQLSRLRELHCDQGQGYLFSRPLHPDAADALLAALPTAVKPRADKVVAKAA